MLRSIALLSASFAVLASSGCSVEALAPQAVVPVVAAAPVVSAPVAAADTNSAPQSATSASPAPVYNNAPPRILVRTTPSELLIVDGDPVLEKEATAPDIKRLVNSPNLVWVDASGKWWLRLQDDWLTAPAIDGPWAFGDVPSTIDAAAQIAGVETGVARASTAVAPSVIIAREPTALVQFKGDPDWTPIGVSGILAADNCDCDAYIDTDSGRCFLNLAGRWYSAEQFSDDATWTYVPANELPPAFNDIPADSPWAHVRAEIPGTPEAEAAARAAQTPQTTQVPRSATITVTYDGEPLFADIPGSDAAWATNTTFAVFRTPGPAFWCCDAGVWYQAAAPQGPWAVATAIPPSLHDIPADNPDHNVTYVTITGSTPGYVDEGYTGGYIGCYVENGCPIYGTGFYAGGYYRNGFACPRPLTWGPRWFFDPTTGAWNRAPGAFGHHDTVAFGGANHHDHVGAGWWGPAGCAPDVAARPDFHHDSNDREHDRPYRERPGQADTGGVIPPPHAQAQGSIYARNPAPAPAPRVSAPAASHDADQRIFLNQDGAVFRRGANGTWEENHDGAWSPVATRPHANEVGVPGGHAVQSAPADGEHASVVPAPGGNQARPSDGLVLRHNEERPATQQQQAPQEPQRQVQQQPQIQQPQQPATPGVREWTPPVQTERPAPVQRYETPAAPPVQSVPQRQQEEDRSGESHGIEHSAGEGAGNRGGSGRLNY